MTIIFYAYNTVLDMSSFDMSFNEILPTLYVNEGSDRHGGLFERMIGEPEPSTNMIETSGTRTITITNSNNLNVTISGDTGAITLSEQREPSPSIYGEELLSRISELSMKIQHDNLYTGDYVRLYNLLTDIVTNCNR